jgi:hypothetical protein
MDERLRRGAERAGVALHALWAPALKAALLFVGVQVLYSQSRTARAAWSRARRLAPDPVLAAAGALGESGVGRAAGHVTAGVRAGADWVFSPLQDRVAARERRARAAGEKAAEYKRRLAEAQAHAARLPEPPLAMPVE